jgi:hypothetical protein
MSFARDLCFSCPSRLGGISFLVDFVSRHRGIIASEEAHQPAVGCRYRRALEIVLNHECRHFLDGHKRPERARSGPHRFLDTKVGFAIELLRAKEAKNDSALVHNDTSVPASRPNAITNRIKTLIQAAGWNVLESDVSCARFLRISPIRRKSGGQPVELAGYVVVYLTKANALEPRRGPRT